MKRIAFAVMLVLSVASSAFAVDGDLIVNGKVGIGTTNPYQKLHVSAGHTVVDNNYYYSAKQVRKSFLTNNRCMIPLYVVGGNHARNKTEISSEAPIAADFT